MDNGFDRELPAVSEWLAFASTQCPLSIWLGMTVGGAFALARSQHTVAEALGTFGEPSEDGLPTGTVEARVVPDIPTLHHLIRPAFQLSKARKGHRGRICPFDNSTEESRALRTGTAGV